jgi:hypothetical protein
VTDWDDAACRDHNPDMWFAGEEHPDTVEAVRICHDCPVRFDCLEFALDERMIEGVWGGYTERQRQRVARGQLPGRVGRDRQAEQVLAPCGSKAARGRHLRRGEDCSVCDGRSFRPAVCGTRSGFQRHGREGTEPCGLCREAERTYQRERKRRERDAA